MNIDFSAQRAAPRAAAAAAPRRTAVAVAALLLMSGCASFQRPLATPEKASLGAASARTVADAGSESSLDIDAGFGSEDVFMLKPVVETSRLPAVQLHGLSVTESGVYDVLRLVLKDTGIALNVEGGSKGSERFGPVAAFDVRGSLGEVLDNLSESIGFFYSYRKNTLFIQQEQQFVVELPPALSEDNAAGLTNTLQFLGAKDPYIDRLNRSLVFRTNRPSLAKISNYLQKIRGTRSLIIYDVNIFQVDLKDNSDTGIQWNRLAWAGTPGTASNPVSTTSIPVTGTTTTTGTPGTPTTAASALAPIGKAISGGLTGLGLGMVLSSSRFSIDMLVDFLQTQGNVKAISRPRLAVISGTKGTLRVGQSTTYVSKVGTNYSTSVSQVTTETKDLKTGLDLALSGDFSDNTVYTRVGLSISEIVSLSKFTALGTDLILPTTADREINTTIRARPGDLFLLGGININRDSSEVRRGITQNGSSDTVTRSELVLAIRAKVVNFRGQNYQSAQTRNAAPQPESVPAVTPASLPPQVPSEPTPSAITTAPSEPVSREPVATAVTTQPKAPGKPANRETVATAASVEPKAPGKPALREAIATAATIQPKATGKPVLRDSGAKAIVMQPKAPGKPVLRDPVAKAVVMQPKARPTAQADRLRSFAEAPLRLTMSTVLGTTLDNSVVALATVRQPNARQR